MPENTFHFVVGHRDMFGFHVCRGFVDAMDNPVPSDSEAFRVAERLLNEAAQRFDGSLYAPVEQVKRIRPLLEQASLVALATDEPYSLRDVETGLEVRAIHKAAA